MGIGFFGSRKEKVLTLESLQHVEDMLKADVAHYEDVEHSFSPLLKTITDAKGNLKIIIEQMEVLKKLVEHRELITTRLIAEEVMLQKGPTEAGVARCKEFFDMLHAIDNELRPRLDVMDKEIRRLRINETAELYLQEKDRETLKGIDKDANFLAVQLLAIHKRVFAFEEELSRVSRRLARHKESVQSASPSKIGFA